VLAAIAGLVEMLAKERCAQHADVRFTRAQVRALTSLSDTRCRMHLDRLAAMEYLLVHRGQRGQSYEYELLHDAPAGADGPHLAGLIDVEALKPTPTGMTTTASSPTPEPKFAGPSRPQRLPDAGPSPTAKPPAKPALARVPADPTDDDSKTLISGAAAAPVMSYPKAVAAPSSLAASLAVAATA
jgi:hypothetical protein